MLKKSESSPSAENEPLLAEFLDNNNGSGTHVSLDSLKFLDNKENEDLFDINFNQSKYKFNNILIDNFFIRLYNYYNGKGFICLILEGFLNLISLFFLVFYSIFLIICIDYKILFETHDIYEAIDFYIFKYLPSFIILCIVLFSIIWLFKFIKFILNIKQLMEIRRFYISKLKITDDLIKTMKWNDISKLIIEYYQNLDIGINSIHKEDKEKEYDIFNILCRIMRKDNFFIAMIDNNILDIKIKIPFFGEHFFLSKSL